MAVLGAGAALAAGRGGRDGGGALRGGRRAGGGDRHVAADGADDGGLAGAGCAVRAAARARVPAAVAAGLPARGVDGGDRARCGDGSGVAGGGAARSGRDRRLCGGTQRPGVGRVGTGWYGGDDPGGPRAGCAAAPPPRPTTRGWRQPISLAAMRSLPPAVERGCRMMMSISRPNTVGRRNRSSRVRPDPTPNDYRCGHNVSNACGCAALWIYRSLDQIQPITFAHAQVTKDPLWSP